MKQKHIKGWKEEKARSGPDVPNVFCAFPYIAKDGTDGTQHRMFSTKDGTGPKLFRKQGKEGNSCWQECQCP